MTKLLLLIFTSILAHLSIAQTYQLTGTIRNSKLEILPFATVQIKGSFMNTVADEKGNYKLELEKGQYEIIVSLVGYKLQTVKLALIRNEVMNMILEELIKQGEEATVIGQRKDRSEQIIRNVIKHKEQVTKAVESYSASLYIKATETVENSKPKKTKPPKDSSKNQPFNLSIAEINMKIDVATPNKIKEFREGIHKKGNTSGLFYLSTTEGDFSLYNNLIKIPAITVTPFLSPISYSGLVAYKYKTVRTVKDSKTGRTYYTISFKPATLSNTTLSGEVVIMDSTWVITESKYSLPKFHLTEYDAFEVNQNYDFVNDSAWLYSKQQFNYKAKDGKAISSGITQVYYSNYLLNPVFPTKHFGVEKSVTTLEAYKRDSSYWQATRAEPLSDKELAFVRYKDSVYFATNNAKYLDSVDKKLNKITLRKVLIDGLTFYKRTENRRIELGSLSNMYEPLQPGGTRVGQSVFYNKTFKNQKSIYGYANLDYGIRNKDVNGTVRFSRMYNPYNFGTYSIETGRVFDFLFEGDVFINSFQKRNIFRKYSLNLEHKRELFNGFYITNRLEFAQRESLEGLNFFDFRSYVTDPALIQLLDSTNKPRSFPKHNVVYNVLKLTYTPFQEYMREPYRKVVLGSKWPTFEINWRKGLPKLLGSGLNYDLLEFNIFQTLKLGTVGESKYTVRLGNFVNRDSLQLPDRKFMRGQDPFIFFAPEYNFQHLDSTFEITKNYLEAHYKHEFNGAILRKIPLLKKLNLRELVGGGLLYVPERNLKYVELWAGIESMTFKLFRQKMKVGLFAVGSVANQFKNPVQIKFSIRSWDRFNNRWQ